MTVPQPTRTTTKTKIPPHVLTAKCAICNARQSVAPGESSRHEDEPPSQVHGWTAQSLLTAVMARQYRNNITSLDAGRWSFRDARVVVEKLWDQYEENCRGADDLFAGYSEGDYCATRIEVAKRRTREGTNDRAHSGWAEQRVCDEHCK